MADINSAGMPLAGNPFPITRPDLIPAQRYYDEAFYRAEVEHLWMHAWIIVLPAEIYGVSSPSGEFRLANVPPGRHHLRFWHEKSGEWDQWVEVPAGGSDLGEMPFPA